MLVHLNPFTKHEPKSHPYTLYENQLKMSYKSNFEIIKLLEDNLHDSGFSKVFFMELQKQGP